MLDLFKELFGIKNKQDTDNIENETKESTKMIVTKQTLIGDIYLRG